MSHTVQAGITQFLDIGAGMAPPGNTHESAQAVSPTARIVYVESGAVPVPVHGAVARRPR